MEEIRGLIKDKIGLWMITAQLLTPARPSPRRRRLPKRTRALLLARQDHRCAICGGPLSLLDAHVDHIVPISAGGDDAMGNLQLVHPNCNLRKGKRLVVGQGTMPWS
jgi:5-methylcytosine-specific restriction endonuclease McrA